MVVVKGQEEDLNVTFCQSDFVDIVLVCGILAFSSKSFPNVIKAGCDSLCTSYHYAGQ